MMESETRQTAGITPSKEQGKAYEQAMMEGRLTHDERGFLRIMATFAKVAAPVSNMDYLQAEQLIKRAQP